MQSESAVGQSSWDPKNEIATELADLGVVARAKATEIV